MNRHIIIFAKVPEPGKVKTRLCGKLTCEDAVELYEAFIADTVATAASCPNCHVVIAYTPAETGGYFMERFGEMGLEFTAQEGGDLGARMHRALYRSFGRGADKALLIGTDIPDITADDISEAFGRLDGSDLVYGPAADGGYWLVGMNSPVPGVFEGVAWSTGDVMKTTLGRAQKLGLTVSLLPEKSDVDTVEDLRRLTACPLPPRTKAVVERLSNKLSEA